MAYFVVPLAVYFVAGWIGASVLWRCVIAGGWIALAVFLIEVLGRGLVDWMRVVRSG